MSFTYYDSFVPLAQRGLKSLKRILAKGQAHADGATFFEARVYPDMFPLSTQIHFACDAATKLAARAEGVEPVTEEDNIASYEAAYARIDKAIEALARLDRDVVNGRPDAIIALGMGPGKSRDVVLKGYTESWGMPNFFFHVMIAYSILRSKGVPVGKRDYLGPMMKPYVDMDQ